MPVARFFLLCCATLLAACSTDIPQGIEAVRPFDLARYEGKWYEVARLEHSFERGLTDVHALYSRQADGSVQVINRGYDPERKAWKEAVGRALFTGPSDVGSLKVSFFGPFYGGYHIMALDQKNYAWSMIVGPDRSYFWILSRQPVLDPGVRQALLAQAEKAGIDTRALIWVSHTRAFE